MKKAVLVISTLLLGAMFLGCSTSTSNAQKSSAPQPNNIDEHNVGITSGEKLDQTDPTLIEGNLEDNDFKN